MSRLRQNLPCRQAILVLPQARGGDIRFQGKSIAATSQVAMGAPSSNGAPPSDRT